MATPTLLPFFTLVLGEGISADPEAVAGVRERDTRGTEVKRGNAEKYRELRGKGEKERGSHISEALCWVLSSCYIFVY